MAMFDQLPKTMILAGFTGALNAAADVFVGALEVTTPMSVTVRWNDETFSDFEDVTGGKLKLALRKYDAVLDSRYRGGYIQVGYGNLEHVANFVEYGHRMVTHWKNKQLYTDARGRKRVRKWGGHRDVGQVQAHPFMRPAFDSSQDRSIDAFVGAIRQTVDRFNAKYGTRPRAA